MNTVNTENRMLFGLLQPDHNLLNSHWLGRQYQWLSKPGNVEWMTEGFSFLAARVTSAFLFSLPPVREVFTMRAIFTNTVCGVCSHVAAAHFNLYSKMKNAFSFQADLVANYLMWDRVFTFTSLEGVDRETREHLLSTLKEPLALDEKVLSAYLEVSGIEEFYPDLQEVWFDEYYVQSNSYYDVRALLPEKASHATRISREAYGFAVHVGEVVRLMEAEGDMSYQVSPYLLWPLGRGLTKELEISRERFLALFEKSIPAPIKECYPQLLAILKENVEKASVKSSGYNLLLAAHSFLRPYFTINGERLGITKVNQYKDDILAYLYFLVYTDEIDSLVEITGRTEAIDDLEKIPVTLVDFVESLKSRPAIEVLFRKTQFRTSELLARLIKVQKTVIANYDKLKAALEGGEMDEEMQELKAELESWFDLRIQVSPHQELPQVENIPPVMSPQGSDHGWEFIPEEGK